MQVVVAACCGTVCALVLAQVCTSIFTSAPHMLLYASCSAQFLCARYSSQVALRKCSAQVALTQVLCAICSVQVCSSLSASAPCKFLCTSCGFTLECTLRTAYVFKCYHFFPAGAAGIGLAYYFLVLPHTQRRSNPRSAMTRAVAQTTRQLPRTSSRMGPERERFETHEPCLQTSTAPIPAEVRNPARPT